VAVISPGSLATIVEQTMFENLNPPTESELVNADWIQPGRSMAPRNKSATMVLTETDGKRISPPLWTREDIQLTKFGFAR
jgi:hypothetical protein